MLYCIAHLSIQEVSQEVSREVSWDEFEMEKPMASVILDISKVSKVGDLSRGWPKGSLFNSYNTAV